MFSLALFLFFAASSHIDLVDQVYEIPANEWRYVELALKQQAAEVSASYQVEAGSKEIRLALMRREDLDHLRDGVPHGVIELTGSSGSGMLRRPLAASAGDYVIVVDNRGAASSRIHLRVRLDFGGPHTAYTQLPPRRQVTVILISFAAFFGIVTWSATRLLRQIRR